MTTQFHALRLLYGVVEAVVKLTSKHGIDLNSVCTTPTRVIVGELRCGKFVHVQHVKAGFGNAERYNISLCDTVNNRITDRTTVTV